jgi:hypothetical protein
MNKFNRFVGENKEEKVVLKLKNNHLSLVDFKTISLWERIQAYFGYGSLNLSDIAHFVSHHLDEVKAATQVQSDLLLQVLATRCYKHNLAIARRGGRVCMYPKEYFLKIKNQSDDQFIKEVFSRLACGGLKQGTYISIL